MTALLGTTETTTRTAGRALRTDRYELTMLSSFIEEGTADHRAVYEAFARRLPKGRRFGVVAGLGRLLNALPDFRFDTSEIDYLLATGAVTPRCADYLAAFRFTGNIDAYREGELYFGGSPVLTVDGRKSEGLLLETLALSILNHDSAVASAGARMVLAARGRPLIEMGGRRTHEDAAVAAARAAYIVGFASTSNLAAGYLYGIPTVGTAAHAFTLAHHTEKAAFASQVAAYGPGTSLLVDTYDIEQGIRNAVEVAGPALGGIRIDSGDLEVEARKARALLDSLGATDTRIVVTSDLDEYVISTLAAAPIDTYGVGTRLVTGSGHPTAGMVYKLVAVADQPGKDAPIRPVAKKASGKANVGGKKIAHRLLRDDGIAYKEQVVVRYLPEAGEALAGRPLQVPVVRNGERVHSPTLNETRQHHAGAIAELSPMDRDLATGTPALDGNR